MAYTIFIDPGHGGEDPGAVYEGRQEKEDNLDMALAVGKLLSEAGIDVVYSRTEDRYDSPYEKAMLGNNSEADLFISFHRNAMPTPGTASGVETLVYSDRGIARELARNINRQLENEGFVNRGVIERPNLVVLRRTRMPAVLVEVGFIDSETDNALFDEKFNEIARGIADGVLETVETPRETQMNQANLEENPMEMNWQMEDRSYPSESLYRVQVGAFKNDYYAKELLNRLLAKGYPAFILQNNGLYRVQVGAFRNLENAIRMEAKLRKDGYSTFITT